ncbi:hypothetical protein I0C86_16830 [Plantactinospora sp. S1510]|uniref:WD40 repeat protein n=1 Tax=Plantactinospora alkalitolerans TaxID=2789879 RepID=A0ABS0GWM4_9ACTN|nr:hypothetical protein [Plantactinospora alkalitolerans]MBF9130611.1 hypothetical protein [Plantactinospora alkalitolerans]
MSSDVSGALRNVFEEMADSAPPPAGLVPATLGRARRQRVARLTVGGGLAAVLCAALVGLLGAIVPLTGGAADQAATGGEGVLPSVVTAYSGVRDPKVTDPSPAFNYSLVLNRKKGRYDRVPYPFAMPSPDGSRVLVGRGDNSRGMSGKGASGGAGPTEVGVLDLANGNVRWIPTPELGVPTVWGYTNLGRWSPDGRQILFTYRPRTAADSGFLLVDPETLRTTFRPLPDLGTQNTHGLDLVWTPGSDGFALTTSPETSAGASGNVTGIRFYDLTGRLLRTVPASASLVEAGWFSPNGSQMALTEPVPVGAQPKVTVADAETGATRQVIALHRPVRLLGWTDERHLLVYVYGDAETPGADERDALLVVDLAGQTVRTIRPAEESPQQMFIGSSEGLPGSAAKLTF